jgi:hypothetical protein
MHVQFTPLSTTFPNTPISFSDQHHVRRTFMYNTPLQRYYEITFSLNMNAMITKTSTKTASQNEPWSLSFLSVKNGAVIPNDEWVPLQFSIKQNTFRHKLPSCVCIRNVTIWKWRQKNDGISTPHTHRPANGRTDIHTCIHTHTEPSTDNVWWIRAQGDDTKPV